MPTIKQLLTKKRNLIIILFIVFIFLRLFVDNHSVFLASDHLKFLEASKRFPTHTLYNDQLYLLHPPLYSYTIYFFTLIFQDEFIAAVIVSLISAIITFFVLYKLFMMLTNNFYLTFFVLVFFTLSDSLIITSNVALRESFLIMLIFSTLYFFIKGVKFSDKKFLMFATISGSVLALTSDHVVFIFPALVLSYLFFNPREIDLRKFKFPNLSYLILPLVIILLFYGSWSLLKFVQYSQYEFYPNGHSGMPIHIQDLGILQTISPQFFEDYHGTVKADYKFVDFAKKLAFNLGYMLNLEPFDIPRGLNFTTMKYLLSLRHIAYMFIIYLPLALLTIYGFIAMIRDFLKSKKIYNNTNLYLLLLFLVFIFPIIQSTVSPRYILTSYIFLFYFISYGIVTLFEKKFKMKIITKIIALIVVLLIILVPFWYLQNNYVVLFSDKEISAQNTGNFINANIPKDAAIMAQAGYTVKLNYLTDNRVLGLYAVPERLPDLIDFFNVSYVVVGRYYTYDAYHLAKDSVEYVRDNPDEFELIATIEEDYSNFFVEDDLARTDEVYIYKVKN